MQFTSYLENGNLTIALTGEIDHHTAKAYMLSITGKLEAYIPKLCVLDFSDVSFMDSSGIAVVINALRQMQQFGGELQVSGLRSQPMKVFLAAGMEKLVKIKETVL